MECWHCTTRGRLERCLNQIDRVSKREDKLCSAAYKHIEVIVESLEVSLPGPWPRYPQDDFFGDCASDTS